LGIDAPAPVGRDDRRRVGLFDDGRAFQRPSRDEFVPLEDRRALEVAGEPDVAHALAHCPGGRRYKRERGRPPLPQLRNADDDKTEEHERLVARVTVGRVVAVAEPFGGRCGRARERLVGPPRLGQR
jgi:hypothetical protein